MKRAIPKSFETERLLLKKVKEPDWKDLHEYFSDFEAVKYTLKKKIDEVETWHIVCGMMGHWQARGYGPYSIHEKNLGRVIGLAGFWFPLYWAGPEIKWALARKYWGNGYAKEAALAVLEISQKHLPELELVSVIQSENAASIKLAESIGAVFKNDVNFNQTDWKVYSYQST